MNDACELVYTPALAATVAMIALLVTSVGLTLSLACIMVLITMRIRSGVGTDTCGRNWDRRGKAEFPGKPLANTSRVRLSGTVSLLTNGEVEYSDTTNANFSNPGVGASKHTQSSALPLVIPSLMLYCSVCMSYGLLP